MNRTRIVIAAAALAVAAAAFPAQAADRRYPIAFVQKVEVTEPSLRRIAWENKEFLDCDDVVLTEEDVRYALRHMRRVSRKAFAPENTDTMGCEGEAFVTFKNGRILAIGIEPTGRISTLEFDAKMKFTPNTTSFYKCGPCRERKMALLKDALNRADERRMKRLVAEGLVSPAEAERRLKMVRASRDLP